MMRTSLALSGAVWISLRSHLLQNEVEQAAIVFANVEASTGEIEFIAREFDLLGPHDFDYQSASHISLTDETRGRVIKRAWDLKLAMVEFHSHVGRFASAAFSPSDWAGFADFVPHVRWRLRGALYAAIVVAAEGFDGLVWLEDDQPVQLDRITIDDEALEPTGVSIARRYEW